MYMKKLQSASRNVLDAVKRQPCCIVLFFFDLGAHVVIRETKNQLL